MITPLNDNVLVKIKKNETTSGLVLSQSEEHKSIGEITSLPETTNEKFKNLKVGSLIVFHEHALGEFTYENDKYSYIHIDNIIAVIN